MVALVPETELPVVKLPERADYTTQRRSPDDNVPLLGLMDQPTSTEPDVFDPLRCSMLEPLSEPTVRLPKPPEPQPANTAGSSVTVQSLSSAVKHDRSLTSFSAQERQEDNSSTLTPSPDVSEESSAESSLDLHSFDNETTVTDACDDVSASVRVPHAAITIHWPRNKASRLSVTLGIYHKRTLLRALWIQTLLSAKARLLMGADL